MKILGIAFIISYNMSQRSSLGNESLSSSQLFFMANKIKIKLVKSETKEKYINLKQKKSQKD